MPIPLRVLFLEDQPADAELLVRELRRAGYDVKGQRVDTEAAYLAALDPVLDLIVSDYGLPQFDGVQALRLLRERGLDIPFILVSGTIGEEVAVAAIQQGAADYLLKDRLARLGPAVAHALEERRLRHEKRQAVQTLRETASQLSLVYSNVSDTIFYLAVEPGDQFRFLSVNLAFLKATRLTEDQVIGKLVQEVIPEPAHAMVLGKYKEAIRDKQTVSWEEVSVYPAGTKYGEVSVTPVFDASGRCTNLIGTIHDITERKQAEDILRESEARYRRTLGNMLEGCQIIGFDWRYLYVNDAAATHGRRTREELLGHTMLEVYPGIETTDLFDRLQSGMTERTPHRLENEFTYPDGAVGYFELSIQPVQEGVFILSIDITERKRAEAESRARGTELAALFDLSTHLRAAQTADDMLPIVLREVRQLLKADSGMVILLQPANSHFAVAQADGDLAPLVGRSFAADSGLSGLVLRTRQPYVTPDYVAEPERLAGWAEAGQIGPAALVPLQSETELLGVLMVARRRGPLAQPFAPAEVHCLAAVGEMVGNALRRARLFDDAERRLRQTQSLRAIDLAISSSLDLRLTLSVVLDQVTTQLGVDAAAVLLLNPRMQTLAFSAGRGFRSKAIEGTRLRLGECYAGRAALERRSVPVPDLNQAHDFTRMPLLRGEDFVSYWGVPLVAKAQVMGVLEVFHRSPLNPDPEWLSFLETLAGQAAIAIENAQLLESLQRSNMDLMLAYDATIEGWSHALDLRDKETEGHTQRVTETTLRLARDMGLNEAELAHVRRGGLLHDIGKMGIPDSILLKPGKLTDEEWVVMRKHPQYAYEMLSPIAYLQPALDIPYCHHERWDGAGYPRGLKGEQIPLAARIFAVVDVWDALRSDRPYRAGWPEAKVREHIRAGSGTHFDSKVVEAFLRAAVQE